MTLGMALQNAAWLSAPGVIYALARRRRPAELGLRAGDARSYAYAAGITVPFAAVCAWLAPGFAAIPGSTWAFYLDKPATAEFIGGALAQGFIATGVPEELLFRGVIAAALFRRYPFWKANCLQAAVFLLPHLGLLLYSTSAWPVVVTLPFAFGLLLGWLFHRSGSIWPPALVHGGGNAVTGLALLDWL